MIGTSKKASNYASLLSKKLLKVKHCPGDISMNEVYLGNGETPNSKSIYLYNSGKSLISSKSGKTVTSLLKSFENNKHVNAIFLRGLGRNFCEGRDSNDQNDPKSLWNEYKMYVDIYNSTTPIATTMHGVNGTSGLAICLLSKLRMASIDATFCAKEGFQGSFPDCGVSYYLSRLKNPGVGLWLALSGTQIDAVSMRTLGMIEYLLPYPHNTEDISREFGLSTHVDRTNCLEMLERSAKMFTECAELNDPLKRYLPYIDLCFGGKTGKERVKSIGNRLSLLSQGELFKAIEIRMQLGEFAALGDVQRMATTFEKSDLPSGISRWALDCLRRICCIPISKINLITQIYAKSLGAESPLECLGTDFKVMANMVSNFGAINPKEAVEKSTEKYKILRRIESSKMESFFYLDSDLDKYFYSRETSKLDFGIFHSPRFHPQYISPPQRSGLSFENSKHQLRTEKTALEKKQEDSQFLANRHLPYKNLADVREKENTVNISIMEQMNEELQKLTPETSKKELWVHKMPETSDVDSNEITSSTEMTENERLGMRQMQIFQEIWRFLRQGEWKRSFHLTKLGLNPNEPIAELNLPDNFFSEDALKNAGYEQATTATVYEEDKNINWTDLYGKYAYIVGGKELDHVVPENNFDPPIKRTQSEKFRLEMRLLEDNYIQARDKERFPNLNNLYKRPHRDEDAIGTLVSDDTISSAIDSPDPISETQLLTTVEELRIEMKTHLPSRTAEENATDRTQSQRDLEEKLFEIDTEINYVLPRSVDGGVEDPLSLDDQNDMAFMFYQCMKNCDSFYENIFQSTQDEKRERFLNEVHDGNSGGMKMIGVKRHNQPFPDIRLDVVNSDKLLITNGFREKRMFIMHENDPTETEYNFEESETDVFAERERVSEPISQKKMEKEKKEMGKFIWKGGRFDYKPEKSEEEETESSDDYDYDLDPSDDLAKTKFEFDHTNSKKFDDSKNLEKEENYTMTVTSESLEDDNYMKSEESEENNKKSEEIDMKSEEIDMSSEETDEKMEETDKKSKEKDEKNSYDEYSVKDESYESDSYQPGITSLDESEFGEKVHKRAIRYKKPSYNRTQEEPLRFGDDFRRNTESNKLKMIFKRFLDSTNIDYGDGDGSGEETAKKMNKKRYRQKEPSGEEEDFQGEREIEKFDENDLFNTKFVDERKMTGQDEDERKRINEMFRRRKYAKGSDYDEK